jgi:hypothetical protein
MPKPRTDIRSDDSSGISDQRAEPHHLDRKVSPAMIKGRYEYGGPPKGYGWDQGTVVGTGGGGGGSGSWGGTLPARRQAAQIVKKKNQKTRLGAALNGTKVVPD